MKIKGVKKSHIMKKNKKTMLELLTKSWYVDWKHHIIYTRSHYSPAISYNLLKKGLGILS
jgi:hypothetical protein